VPTKIEEKKPEETIQSNGHTPTSAAAAASVITAAAAVPITMTKAELFAKYLLMEQRMNALEKSVTGIDNTIYNDLKRIVQLETRVRHIDAQISIDTKEATDAITELQKKVEDIVNVQNAETT
jgi:predicted phage-related endonuclease